MSIQTLHTAPGHAGPGCSLPTVPPTVERPSAGHPLSEAVAALESALDRVAATAEWTAVDDLVLDCLARLTRASARLDAQRLRWLHEADSRGVVVARGAPSTAGWLGSVLGVRSRTASREVVLAEDLTTQCARTGEALAAGSISTDAAAVIARAVHNLPSHLHERREEAEQLLLDAAQEHDPATLARIARHLRAVTMAEREPDDELAQRPELHLVPDIDDSGMLVRGRLDAVTGDLLRTALDAFAAPRPADDGTPDRRSPARRNADALTELLRGVLDGGGLPTSGGHRPHLTLTVDWDSLRAQVASSPALTSWDTLLTPRTVRRLACDARIIPVVLGAESQPLDVGRATYTVPAPMRAALTARDRGCAFPGCDRPPGWCHAHHIKHWVDGGDTRLENLVLLCGHHHRLIHVGDWQVSLGGEGLPEFRPPPWIDPAQTPRTERWRATPLMLNPTGTDPPRHHPPAA